MRKGVEKGICRTNVKLLRTRLISIDESVICDTDTFQMYQ